MLYDKFYVIKSNSDCYFSMGKDSWTDSQVHATRYLTYQAAVEDMWHLINYALHPHVVLRIVTVRCKESE